MPLCGCLGAKDMQREHQKAATALVVLNLLLALLGLILIVVASTTSEDGGATDADVPVEDDQANVLDLLTTFGICALVLGAVGLAGVLTGRNLMYVYFVALFLSIVLGFWAGCMVLSHADEVEDEVRLRASKDWQHTFGLLPQDVQLAANASEAERGGCFRVYSAACWDRVKEEFAPTLYTRVGVLALLLVALMLAALGSAKQVIGVEQIVRKTELLLAHIGLFSGWLLIGLALTDDRDLSSSLGAALSSIILVTGCSLIGLSVWSYLNLWLPKAGRGGQITAKGLRTLNVVLLLVVSVILLFIARSCFFEKAQVLGQLKATIGDDEELSKLLHEYQELLECNSTSIPASGQTESSGVGRAGNETVAGSPLGSVINCEAEDLAWRDLAYSIEAELNSWGWIVMLLLLFVLVRVVCVCWLLQHSNHRGYETVSGDITNSSELERIEAELEKRAGVSSRGAPKSKRGTFAPYAALARESTFGESDSDADEGSAGIAEMSSDQILQQHRRSSMSGSESDTEGSASLAVAARRVLVESQPARP